MFNPFKHEKKFCCICSPIVFRNCLFLLIHLHISSVELTKSPSRISNPKAVGETIYSVFCLVEIGRLKPTRLKGNSPIQKCLESNFLA